MPAAETGARDVAYGLWYASAFPDDMATVGSYWDSLRGDDRLLWCRLAGLDISYRTAPWAQVPAVLRALACNRFLRYSEMVRAFDGWKLARPAGKNAAPAAVLRSLGLAS